MRKSVSLRALFSLTLSTLTLSSLCVTSAYAQKEESTKDTAGDIASQPAQDVNLKKLKIPPKLKAIQKKPYSLKNLNNCASLAREIAELNEVLGPDIDDKASQSASKKRKETAKRVSGSITGGFIPFRGIVREVSGAAKAQRKYNRAVVAGVTRRAFLKGIGQQKGCGQSARPTSVK